MHDSRRSSYVFHSAGMLRAAFRPFGQRFLLAAIHPQQQQPQTTTRCQSTAQQPDPKRSASADTVEPNATESPVKNAQQQQHHAAHRPPQPPPPPSVDETVGDDDTKTNTTNTNDIAIADADANRGSGSGSGTFEGITVKNRSAFVQAVRIFETRSVHRRNHVEFIYAALRNMESFGVHRDIEVYKALMNVLPKGKYIPTNIIQAEFQHYPKQQQVIVDLLEQMEDNAVIPDHEMQDILVNTFGRRGHPVLKYWRMLYWMPKFKNSSPWLLPDPVPEDVQELARLAVERMCSVDLQSEVRVYDSADVEGAIDRTWIVSGMSAEQRELLQRHGDRVPLRVEGPFVIWLRHRQVHYFTLRGDAAAKVEDERSGADVDVDGEMVKVQSLSCYLIRTVICFPFGV